MKLLSKEEEEAHYNETLKGGVGGGVVGLAVGLAGVYAAAARYPAFRHLTLPLKAFIVTSSGTFTAIVSADRYSRAFEASRHSDAQFQDSTSKNRAAIQSQETSFERFRTWGRENRYPIVGVSWVLSMAIALGIVGRSPYLSTSQKIVQSRVYAQGLTVAVLLATAAFEIGDQRNGEGRWETVKIVDPDDPEHKHLIEKEVHHERYKGEDQWKDMVEAEEEKLKEREQAVKEQEEKDAREGKIKHKKHDHHKHAKHGHNQQSAKNEEKTSSD